MRGAGSIHSFFLTILVSTFLVACGGGGTATPPQVSTALVDITVLDSDNQPVPGATVTIASDPVVTVTDSVGHCQVEIEIGSHSVTVTKNGYTLVNQQALNISQDQSMDMNPDPGIVFYDNGRTWYPDGDGDGYSTGAAIFSQSPDPGYYLSTQLTALSGDCDDTNPFIHPFQAEICNNVDDNCGGGVDENLDRATTCGVGLCSGNTGTETCTAGVWGGNTCDPFFGVTEEVCDIMDNDCDGDTDEDASGNPLRQTCYTGPSGTRGIGQCQDGYQTCVGGSFGNCEFDITPTAESCDNLDNNCDGTIDSFNRATSCGLGACSGNTGVETCTAGTWGADTCNPVSGSSMEVCDNIDNDCDGVIDNFTRVTTCGIGECSTNTGSETCTAGEWDGDNCDPLAGSIAEICDNLDNDCDGYTDEDISGNPLTQACYSGDPSTRGIGECRDGYKTCIYGGYTSCQGDITPATEVCDGLDNNCDHNVDEGLTITLYADNDRDGYGDSTSTPVQSCTTQSGYAANSSDCDDGNESIYPGAPEACNNLDDNCDGTPDEGNPDGGATCNTGFPGVCADGIVTCINGGHQCVPVTPTYSEICDGNDNDCDGSVDEDLIRVTSCGLGECDGNSGTETCDAGSWVNDTCDPLAGAVAETCDNLDNDCDGTIDENLTRPTTCGSGQCSGNAGTESCTAGIWGSDTCDPTAGASAEICDGLDNDCDGFDDNGNPGGGAACNSGLFGVCTDGTVTCQSGTLHCQPDVAATQELCDNLDNDCDGSVDEIGCSSILLVDDDNGLNNRSSDQVDDPDVDHIYMADLTALGYSFDLYRVIGPFTNGPDLTSLQQYPVVVWFTGESYSMTNGDPLNLTLNDQNNLISYLGAGGNLFLSGGDILWDLNCMDDGPIPSDPTSCGMFSTFVKTYLGVQDVTNDTAVLPTTYGVTSDVVSDGLVIAGVDSDQNNYVDGFSFDESVIASETGTYNWDTSRGWPGQITFTADAGGSFASTVFADSYPVLELTDTTLSLGSHYLWSLSDGNVDMKTHWIELENNSIPNQYCFMQVWASTYSYNRHGAISYNSYPDVINSTGNPAHTQPLMLDENGSTVAVRSEISPWKTIFLAFPYEGLTSEADRRQLLQNSINWLLP